MIMTQEQLEQQAAEQDMRILHAYVNARYEVVRMFDDPVRRRRLEVLAGKSGVVIPKNIFKGI